jgi:serine/threonine protein kinase
VRDHEHPATGCTCIGSDDGSSAVDPLIGATIGGRYTIRRLLARGGVGLVYLAQQRDPDREVVVKVLAPNWIDNTEAVARFEREGQRLGAVQHANIVSLYECGHENGVAYLAMEYLVGELLSDYLARKGGASASRSSSRSPRRSSRASATPTRAG